MKRYITMIVLVFMLGCGSQPDSDSSTNTVASLTATVVFYETGVEWDHFDDESFDVGDQLQLTLAPNGDALSVSLSPGTLPDDSPFRIAGTRFSFQVDSPISSGTMLAWGALNNPTVIE